MRGGRSNQSTIFERVAATIDGWFWTMSALLSDIEAAVERRVKSI